MDGYVELPKKLSSLKTFDDDSGDDLDPPRNKSSKGSRKEKVTKYAIRSDDPEQVARVGGRPGRSLSPSSRSRGPADEEDLDHYGEKGSERMVRRQDSWTKDDEIAMLRRELRDRDQECLDLKLEARELAREVKQLRKKLAKRHEPEPEERPTYIKVDRKYLEPETLISYKLPWEYDPHNDDFVIIKRYIDQDLQRELFEHSREIQERKDVLQRREDRIARRENEEREQRMREDYERKETSHARRRSRSSDYGNRRERHRRERLSLATSSADDGWRFTGAAETPRDDVERPRPRGGPR